VVDQEIVLLGTCTAIGAHSVELTLQPNERQKLVPVFERATRLRAELETARQKLPELEARLEAETDPKRQVPLKQSFDQLSKRVAELSLRGREPVRVVDADRLIAWQLYWRGENFWAGGEIWPWLPEMKTSFPNPNNVEFNKYINDRARAPAGRRYFVVTEAGRLSGMRSLLPTPRARESFEILDTTSNKFSLGAFDL
jgi:hypothetical protein